MMRKSILLIIDGSEINVGLIVDPNDDHLLTCDKQPFQPQLSITVIIEYMRNKTVAIISF